jgi:hypothetical protein
MRHRFHSICPYFAMFPEWFVRRHLVWAGPNGVVFDPFSGRGTTVFESLLNQRQAAGCDVNPVAVCVSNAKADPPTAVDALRRLDTIAARPRDTADDIQQSPFFLACFHPETLKELLHLRRHLRWRQRIDDCFIAGIALGCLHGESHRSGRYFSNRMPRTISTKPAYSLRWWRERGYVAPRRSVFEILKEQIAYRFVSDPPVIRGRVAQSDARHATTSFPEMKQRVSLVITSPPYLDTTNFREDQWLRIWFLGGPPKPCTARLGDDRHGTASAYWRFLIQAWQGVAPLLIKDAHVIIRIGGRKLRGAEMRDGLFETLKTGLNRRLELVEETISEIVGGQRQAFHPQGQATRFEHDFHFALLRV